MSHAPAQDDFRPTASWPKLWYRAELLRRTREFFHRERFLEVETPILSADTVVDRHLDPFSVVEGTANHRLWLQTSPEFAMKRLLASGAESIYQITRAFRRDEQGPLHNGEFTMVEWYRAGDSMAEGMQLLSDLGQELLARGPAELISYAEAFRRHLGVDPHAASSERLIATARDLGLNPPESLLPDDRDGWLDLLLVERVQPHLGVTRPAIVFDYPATQSALAQVRVEDGSPPVAERFELYVSGIELANGYHELTDPDVLRRRNAAANAQRISDGKPPLPEESRLLAAMEAGLPPSTGVALGFDRVVMLAAGATRLDEVIAFPMDRA
jgi:elongation factor P--(R)-beta-lysine ligase